MHHLLVTIGSHGDTHPFIAIGAKLRERGHRVTVVANGHFEPLIRAEGLEFIQLGTAEEYLANIGSPDSKLWHPVHGFKAVFELGVLPLMRKTFEIVKQQYVPGETIVTAHAIAFGARIAQEVLGLPMVTLDLAPAVFRSAYDAPRFAYMPWLRRLPAPMIRGINRLIDAAVVDPVIARPVNAFRAEFGLAPVKRIIHGWWNSPQRVIGLFPEWYGPSQTDWPTQVKLTGFPLYDERGVNSLSPELAAFLDAGPPPIAFTFGSAMTQARPQLAASAEACRLAGIRGIMLTRHPAQVPENLPEGVKHFDYAPFSELLPRCAALVHHGGIGTTSQALAAGIPQIIMPLAHDQHDNASRVRRLNAGVEIPTNKYQARHVADVLRRMLEDSRMQACCRDVADRFRGHDAIGETCDLIEKLVNEPKAAACSVS